MENILINKNELNNLIDKRISNGIKKFKKEVFNNDFKEFIRTKKLDKIVTDIENKKRKVKTFKNKNDFFNEIKNV